MARMAACIWAEFFAIVHIYWLVGGRTGLPRDVRIEFGSPLFVAALAAVPLLAISGAAAMLAQLHSTCRLRKLSALWVGFTALFGLAHAIPPLLDHFAQFSVGGDIGLSERERYALYLYEPNWLLGGVLYAMAFRVTRKS